MTKGDRVIEYYKGFQLIARDGTVKAEGRAYHLITNKKFSTTGSDVPAVFVELRATVDEDVEKYKEVYREAVSRKHQEVLASLGKPDQGRGKVSTLPRASHCYKCKGPVANVFDVECIACGWIVCNYCASCGCGYGGRSY